MTENQSQTSDIRYGWVEYATRQHTQFWREAGLTHRQLLMLDAALRDNPLLNPPRPALSTKHRIIRCAGCDEMVEVTYTTRPPAYCPRCAAIRRTRR